MPNISSIINKSIIKKLRNNQPTVPPKCNCTKKTNYPLKKMCQFECIVYNVELYGRRSNDSHVSGNF